MIALASPWQAAVTVAYVAGAWFALWVLAFRRLRRHEHRTEG